MANDTDSNITLKVAKVIQPAFEASRVVSKTVNTQLLDSQGLGTPDFGETMKFKRPTQYRAAETSDGDLTSSGLNDIIVGSSVGTVQNMISVRVEYNTVEEALRLNQLEMLLKPAAEELVTRLETNLGSFMINQAGLTVGTPGAAVTQWSDVAGANSLLSSIGVPMAGERYYTTNFFNTQNLADVQGQLSNGNDSLVNEAWENAKIARPFAGMQGMSSNALSSYTAGALAGSTGTIGATPIATYVAHKDSMIQSLSLSGLTVSTVGAVRAGDVIEITDNNRNLVNVATRKTINGATGAAVKWRYTVVTGGDTDGSGDVTVQVTAAAINEGATGQYNNISSPVTSGDAFAILGTADQEYQPSMFYHKQAFGLGTVELPKLHTTDTVFNTIDGLSVRVSKYADGTKNLNQMRFDIMPAFACFNPQFAGRGWGA